MTEKLIFRELTMNDAASLFDIYSDKEAMKYRGSKPMESLADAEAFVNNKQIQKDNILTLRKGVEIVNSKELIGTVMFKFYEAKKESCQIGYSIGPKYWRKGFGTKIVSMMIDELVANEEVNLINAWSNKENKASISILEKFGFKKVEQELYTERILYEKHI